MDVVQTTIALPCLAVAVLSAMAWSSSRGTVLRPPAPSPSRLDISAPMASEADAIADSAASVHPSRPADSPGGRTVRGQPTAG